VQFRRKVFLHRACLHCTSVCHLSNHHNCVTAPFTRPPGWACAWRKLLLDFIVQGKITEADTLTIRVGATQSGLISNSPPSIPHFYAGCPSCRTLPIYPGLGQAREYAGLHVPVACFVYHMSKLHKIFTTYSLWPWLDLTLMTIQYIIVLLALWIAGQVVTPLGDKCTRPPRALCRHHALFACSGRVHSPPREVTGESLIPLIALLSLLLIICLICAPCGSGAVSKWVSV